MLPAPGTTSVDTYGYDDLGNITSKSDYASAYTYGTNRITSTAGPHAVVTTSNGAAYTYDPNGNLTSSTGPSARSVEFDSLDRPVKSR